MTKKDTVKRFLPITSCSDCIWHYNVWSVGFYCCYFGKDDNRDLSNDLKIPDWCPLEKCKVAKEPDQGGE